MSDLSQYEVAMPGPERMGEPDHTPAEELADPMPNLVRDPA